MEDDDGTPFLGPLSEAVRTGSYRDQLTAMIQIAAHEIEGNRCKACQMTQMRTGEFSALMLRLQKLLEEREALPPDAPAEVPKGVTSLASIRDRRPSGGDGVAAPSDPARPPLGTKNAPRRQGGRKRSG